MAETNNEERGAYPTTSDVGAQRIARVYAGAFLNAADKRGQMDAVVEELESLVNDVFQKNPQLETFLSSGAVGRHHKQTVIQRAFAGRVDEVFTNFLLVVNNHERLDLLRPIAAAARALRDERARRIRVEVHTAVPLPEDQRERLRQQLQTSLHQDPILQARIDPDLIGGLVLRVGDRVYDASIRTQLRNIRHQLYERTSYEIQSGRDRFSSTNGD